MVPTWEEKIRNEAVVDNYNIMLVVTGARGSKTVLMGKKYVYMCAQQTIGVKKKKWTHLDGFSTCRYDEVAAPDLREKR